MLKQSIKTLFISCQVRLPLDEHLSFSSVYLGLYLWVPSVNEMRRYFFCLIADGCNCGGRRRETEVTEIVVRGKEPGSGSAPGRNGEGSQRLATYRRNSEDEDMKDVMPPSFPFISINHRVVS